jgi:hypothetical protein
MKKINKPTPAKWSKVSAACIALATFIAGYGLTAQNQIVGFIGLGIGCIGIVIPFVTGEDVK